MTQFELNRQLRRLWSEHVMWTRTVIVSAVAGLGDLDNVTDRLLRNPTDMAQVLALFYGAESADAFRILLEDHLKIAAEVLMATMSGEDDIAKQYSDLWYANGAAIAALLGRINDYWTEEEWKVLLDEHLDMVKHYMMIRINRAYSEDPSSYDQMAAQALAMADLMTAGTARQFDL